MLEEDFMVRHAYRDSNLLPKTWSEFDRRTKQLSRCACECQSLCPVLIWVGILLQHLFFVLCMSSFFFQSIALCGRAVIG